MSLIKRKSRVDREPERTLIVVSGLIPAIILITFYIFTLRTMTALAAPMAPASYIIEVSGVRNCREMNYSNQMARLVVSPTEEFMTRSDQQAGGIIEITDPPKPRPDEQSFSETDCMYCHTLHGPNPTGQLNPALTYWGHPLTLTQRIGTHNHRDSKQ